jgi:predicted nucleic acid-binding Zn ribbon protein
MKQKNEQSLKEVLKQIIRLYGLEKRYEQTEIGQIWNEMLGPSVARMTRSVKFEKGTLTVYLESSLIKQELNMHRSKLARSLNEAIGKELVKEVILR